MTQRIKFQKEFRTVKDIKEFKIAISNLTGCSDVMMDIQIQGTFKIVNKSMWDNELNLEYDWYDVTKIGNSYLDVYVPQERKTYKVYPSQSMMIYRKPSIRIFAENFTDVSIIYP